MNSSNISKLINVENPCYHQDVIFDISMLCLATAIIIVQSFIIYVFISSRRLKRTAINHTLFNLSLTDLIAGVSIFFQVFSNLLYCKINIKAYVNISITAYTLSNICLYSSIGHLLVISTDRYISITHALQYNAIATKKRIWRCSFIIYIISIIIPTTEIVLFLTHPGFRNNRGYVYLGVSIVMLCLIGVSSWQYTLLFYRTNRLIKSSVIIQETCMQLKKQHRALCIYFAMFAAFLLVCLPYYILKTLIVFKLIEASPYASIKKIFMFLRFSISIINPLILTLKKVDYRTECLRYLLQRFHINRMKRYKESITLLTMN